MTLWFVGTGIAGFDSVPRGAADVLGRADRVYVEQFTSPIPDGEIEKISGITPARITRVERMHVEDGSDILRDASSCSTVLLSYGDPFVATTHLELRTRAARRGIDAKCIHASSSIHSMVGECGLHHYKVGRIATVMADPKSHTTPYHTIYRNVISGDHTVLLLEYDQSKEFFLDPGDALCALLDAEAGQSRNVIAPTTYAVVASRIGQGDQDISAGSISSLAKVGFGAPPHSIIVPGSLHFTESDALECFARCIDKPYGNTDRTRSISAQMMEKYVPMVRDAIEEVRPVCGKADRYMLENAELYVRDAEKALEDGHDELAVLSIGYADGLADALRIIHDMGPRM